MRLICVLALLAAGCATPPAEFTARDRACRAAYGTSFGLDRIQAVRKCLREDGWVRQDGRWVKVETDAEMLRREINAHLPPEAIPPAALVREMGWSGER